MRGRTLGRRAFSASPVDRPLFNKILIANRGEIACRVIRTARRMGIPTVAVFSDPDASGMHVEQATESVCIGPAQSSQSYLSIPRILAAIRSTGAQAVHPGYGFLSENAGFSRTLEEAGVKFIGPRAHSMEVMGDKIRSKEFARKAKVHTIPGWTGTLASAEEAVRVAREVGYPVMIKASAGGGGKGMRIARTDAEAREGYRLSKEEAKSSFGDDRLFVEKFIENPRHIEIQLIADAHGNVAALPERECSIQRRNQKVIEESPSTLLTPTTRAAMQKQACDLALAVGYESAGTVEFLADNNQNFYFLEMNTRLQVEHPVSEAVTGLDLVELMIRVAAGEKLPPALRGGAVGFNGHAFEARVYAEDPFRGFLPSTGRLSRYSEPLAWGGVDPYLSEGIRCDSGVQQGSEISMFYDPMICKLVTHGSTRDSALDRLRASLDAYVIQGVGHNVSFLRALTDHPRFCRGSITTQFIQEEWPEGFKGIALSQAHMEEVAALAAIMHSMREASFGGDFGGGGSGEGEGEAEARQVLMVTLGAAEGKERGPVFTVSLPSTSDWAREAGEWEVEVTQGDGSGSGSGSKRAVTLERLYWALDNPSVLFASLPEGTEPAEHPEQPSQRTLRLQNLGKTPSGYALQFRGALLHATVRTPREHALGAFMLPKAKRDTSKVLVSPMPGRLVSLAVKVGDSVEVGQELAIVEVRAPFLPPPPAPARAHAVQHPRFILQACALTHLTPPTPPSALLPPLLPPRQ
jgi:propionyl-CoA carboxylase alpha chain